MMSGGKQMLFGKKKILEELKKPRFEKTKQKRL